MPVRTRHPSLPAVESHCGPQGAAAPEHSRRLPHSSQSLLSSCCHGAALRTGPALRPLPPHGMSQRDDETQGRGRTHLATCSFRRVQQQRTEESSVFSAIIVCHVQDALRGACPRNPPEIQPSPRRSRAEGGQIAARVLARESGDRTTDAVVRSPTLPTAQPRRRWTDRCTSSRTRIR